MIYQPIKKASSLAGGSGRDVAAAGLSADIYGPLKSHRGGRNGQTIDSVCLASFARAVTARSRQSGC